MSEQDYLSRRHTQQARRAPSRPRLVRHCTAWLMAVEDDVYSETLLEFPAVLVPVIMTGVLTVVYGAMLLWVARATVWELRQIACCAERRRPCAHALDNNTLVLCITCVACLASLCRAMFVFVPTLLHATLHIDALTVVAANFDRVLGAVCDCVWFGAVAQFIAFWLELLATMQAAKRVRKCCWFSAVASTLFATFRIGGPLVVTFSRTAQRITLALAFVVAWTTLAVGAVAALRLCCRMRSAIAKNPAARAIRIKMLRMCRFIAVNGALFILLNATIGLGWLGRSLTERSDPLTVLAWEAPRHVVRIALYARCVLRDYRYYISCESCSQFDSLVPLTCYLTIHYASVAWFNTASTRRRTVRGCVYACGKRSVHRAAAAIARRSACELSNDANDAAAVIVGAEPIEASSLMHMADPRGDAGPDDDMYSRADSPHDRKERVGGVRLLRELSGVLYPSLRSSRRLWGGKTLEEIYVVLEAGAVLRDRTWLGKTYRACAEAQEMVDVLVDLDCIAEKYGEIYAETAAEKKKSVRHARQFAVEICRELQRNKAIVHVWGNTELSTFRDKRNMLFRFCLVPCSGAGESEERASNGIAVVAYDLSIALTPKNSMLSLVERTPNSTPLGSRESLTVDVVRRKSSASSSFPSPPLVMALFDVPLVASLASSSDDGGDANHSGDDGGVALAGKHDAGNASPLTLVV